MDCITQKVVLSVCTSAAASRVLANSGLDAGSPSSRCQAGTGDRPAGLSRRVLIARLPSQLSLDPDRALPAAARRQGRAPGSAGLPVGGGVDGAPGCDALVPSGLPGWAIAAQ